MNPQLPGRGSHVPEAVEVGRQRRDAGASTIALDECLDLALAQFAALLDEVHQVQQGHLAPHVVVSCHRPRHHSAADHAQSPVGLSP